MSERTFRAVVAAVLVGALALASVVAAAILLPRPAEPRPSPTRPAPSPAPSAIATPVAGPVFGVPDVVSVGLIPRGSSSAPTLRLEFVESSIGAIADAPGSLRITLTDRDGDGSTVAFVGTPSVSAPGSLGVTVAHAAPNVLTVDIVASDRANVEPITITGLGIRVADAAAIGPLVAQVDGFTGSLASGTAGDALSSPGSVVDLE